MTYELNKLNELTHEKLDNAVKAMVIPKISKEASFLYIKKSWLIKANGSLSAHERLLYLLEEQNHTAEEFLLHLSVYGHLLEVADLTKEDELFSAGKLFLQFKSFGDYGCDIINKSNTCLHQAIILGNRNAIHLVNLLLENGANPALQNRYGAKPIYRAIDKFNTLSSFHELKGSMRLVSCLLLGKMASAEDAMNHLFSLKISRDLIKKILFDIAEIAKEKNLGLTGDEIITLGESKLEAMDAPNVQLCKEVGNGAYGSVHLGFMSNKERQFTVAIKCNESNSEMAIKNEVAILKQLTHFNIVGYIGTLQISNKFSMVLQYANNGNLLQFIMKKEPDYVSKYLYSYTKQMILGLSYVHDMGFVHLDFKPANILIHNDTLLIADFGSAANYGGSRLYPVTTTDFKAPELYDTKTPYTYSNDIYSFGVVLGIFATKNNAYPELLKASYKEGEYAWDEYDLKVEKSIREGKQPSFGDKTMPPKIEELVKLCLFQDPTKRPTGKGIDDYIELHKTVFEMN